MKNFYEFSEEEKLSILGGKTGEMALDEGDCLGIFGGGCKEGCKPGCKDGCKESSKNGTLDPGIGTTPVGPGK